MPNYERFHKVLGAFSERIGKTMSAALLELYWNALKDMTDDEFTDAANRLFRENRYNTFPAPAEFLEGLSATTTDLATLAPDVILKKMRDDGGDADVVFDDPAIMSAIEMMGGWPYLCDYANSFDLEKLGLWKNEVRQAYRIAAARCKTAPCVLLGRHSQQNIASGYLNPSSGALANQIGETIKVMPWPGKLISGGKKELPVLDDVSGGVGADVCSILKRLQETP